MKKSYILSFVFSTLMLCACNGEKKADSTNQNETINTQETIVATNESAPLSIKSFYKEADFPPFVFVDLKQLKDDLLANGYVMTEDKSATPEDHPDDLRYFPNWTYTKEGTSVTLFAFESRPEEVYFVEINFPSSKEANEFIDNVKADGFKENSAGSYEKGSELSIVVEQEGSQIKISQFDED